MTGGDPEWTERIRAGRAEVRTLSERFPDVLIWFGERTLSYWALVTVEGRSVLVEAKRPNELADGILKARMWPWP